MEEQHHSNGSFANSEEEETLSASDFLPPPSLSDNDDGYDNAAEEEHSTSVMMELGKKCYDEKHEMKIQELLKEGQQKANECHEAWMCQQDSIREVEKLRNDLHFKSFYASTLEGKITELEEANQLLENAKRSNDQSLQDLHTKLQALKDEYSKVSQEARSLDLVGIHEITDALKCLGIQYDELKKKYVQECKERKHLYNELLELKGNIRVFCRCRPLREEEVASGFLSVVEFDKSKDNELYFGANSNNKKSFKFDRVFTPEDSQETVFAETAPVVASVLDGYNVCIFAYGQTGTGKTFTMEGTPDNRGVNYRTLQELFKVAEERKGQFNYDISVSVLEVYNEQIRDLLAAPGQQGQQVKKLEIRQLGEGIQHVPGLVEAKVRNMDEVWEVLQTGSAARAVGTTNANEMSSRSHCILNVLVRAESLIDGTITTSKMWLVDLAGSERLAKTDAQGERLKEAQNINKSLSALGDVISALSSKNGHIPYRNSKLTHLLQDSLGGDSKTLMFVQISPTQVDAGETLCSLNFATRVRGVELGPIRKQQDISEALKYKQMVEKMKQDGKEAKKMEETLQNMEIKFKGKEHMCKNLQDKIKELETQLAKERKSRQQCETKIRELQKQSEKIAEKPPLHFPANRRIPLGKKIANIPERSTKQQQSLMSLKIDSADKENLGKMTLGDKRKARYSMCESVSFNPLMAPARRVSMIPAPPARKALKPEDAPGVVRNIRAAPRASFGGWPRKHAAASVGMPRSSLAVVPSIVGEIHGMASPEPQLQPPRSQFVITPNKNAVAGTPMSLRGVKNSHTLQKFREAINCKVNNNVRSGQSSAGGTLDAAKPLEKLPAYNANRFRRLSRLWAFHPPVSSGIGGVRAQRVMNANNNRSSAA